MKKEELKELFRKKTVKAGSLALAAVIAVGSLWAVNQQSTVVPELVTFVDMDESVVIEGEEVPLASTKVTKSTKTTKKTKKIKLKKASKKTYKKAGKTTKKTNTKKTTSSAATTTTKTETTTKVTNQYKKGSKVNTQVTTVKTTVTKTVVSKQSTAAKKTASTTETQANGEISIKVAAPKVDSRVASAFETLHFTINVNSGVSYSGKFSAKSQDITLKKVNDTVYHELGHFAAFVAGNVDMTSEWQAVYNSEKSLYTASNKAYVLSSASEYFAESFKDYTLNPAALKAERPQTYAAIDAALAKITGAQVSAVWNRYKSVWK